MLRITTISTILWLEQTFPMFIYWTEKSTEIINANKEEGSPLSQRRSFKKIHSIDWIFVIQIFRCKGSHYFPIHNYFSIFFFKMAKNILKREKKRKYCLFWQYFPLSYLRISQYIIFLVFHKASSSGFSNLLFIFGKCFLLRSQISLRFSYSSRWRSK